MKECHILLKCYYKWTSMYTSMYRYCTKHLENVILIRQIKFSKYLYLCGVTIASCNPGPSTVSSHFVRAQGSGLVNDNSAFIFSPTLPEAGT